jgi:hypothetical protein
MHRLQRLSLLRLKILHSMFLLYDSYHRITVRSLDLSTDLRALASDIVDKCKLIHPSKVSVCSLGATIRSTLHAAGM